jgi:hypothetical protein
MQTSGRSTAHENYILIEDIVPYDAALRKVVYHGDNWQTKVALPNKSGFYLQIQSIRSFPLLSPRLTSGTLWGIRCMRA